MIYYFATYFFFFFSAKCAWNSYPTDIYLVVLFERCVASPQFSQHEQGIARVDLKMLLLGHRVHFHFQMMPPSCEQRAPICERAKGRNPHNDSRKSERKWSRWLHWLLLRSFWDLFPCQQSPKPIHCQDYCRGSFSPSQGSLLPLRAFFFPSRFSLLFCVNCYSDLNYYKIRVCSRIGEEGRHIIIECLPLNFFFYRKTK